MKHMIDIDSDTSMYGPLHFFLHFEVDGTVQLLYSTEELRLIVCGEENSSLIDNLENKERVLGIYEQIMFTDKRDYRVADASEIHEVTDEARRMGCLTNEMMDWIYDVWATASEKTVEYTEDLAAVTRVKAENGEL
ncbi:hypothetical protein [uncultured Cohaesibacter sp.]|uniref:hypothetical protein n=1 Tax=uncultured Cohaesibacter sp. TaxID=1002546 RepID=UPI0029C8A5C1|nr:hypothetical protein [uncultured Cohaesibacter sp.]